MPANIRVQSLQIRGYDPLSFVLDGGTCLAVQGPSGTGKSLLLRAIADLDPAHGKIFLNGRERSEVTGPEWRRCVRYAAAEPGWWAETVRAHFSENNKSVFSENNKSVGAETENLDVENMTTALGLSVDLLDRPVSELSTGERQRFALIRAVADSPQVLLLDEPTGALDSKAAAYAETLIKKQLERGCAIMLVTHDPDQALRLANRRLHLENGIARLEDI